MKVTIFFLGDGDGGGLVPLPRYPVLEIPEPP